ncbi:hypothetical protein T484DRAFT_1827814 [Baffinella frigidus]|nr:hypothetical protein T484DRAFT_1827814 [Cryptophyta sp. CCMP2293]
MNPCKGRPGRQLVHATLLFVVVATGSRLLGASAQEADGGAEARAGDVTLEEGWWSTLPPSLRAWVSAIPAVGADAAWRASAAPGGWGARDLGKSRIEEPPGVLLVYYDASVNPTEAELQG